MTAAIRQFETGATRDRNEDKLNIEGFLSPAVLQRYCEYMHVNRVQPDGAVRNGDNWQKGIPRDAYMDSLLRHVMDAWMIHRGLPAREDHETALCGILFNAMGYLFEILKAKRAAETKAAKAAQE